MLLQNVKCSMVRSCRIKSRVHHDEVQIMWKIERNDLKVRVMRNLHLISDNAVIALKICLPLSTNCL